MIYSFKITRVRTKASFVMGFKLLMLKVMENNGNKVTEVK